MKKFFKAASLLSLMLALSTAGMAQEAEKPATKPAEKPEATSAPAIEKTAAADENSAEATIRKAIEKYTECYNKRDAATLAKCWCAAATRIDPVTGEKITGREAIEKDFAKMFAADESVELYVNVDNIRFIRPDVAQISGQAVTIAEGEEPSDTTFTAILVKDAKEGWQLDSVSETVVPAEAKPEDYLSDLSFLVGHWIDDSEDIRVDTNVRWSPNKAFLVRSYTVQREGQDEHQGTQVIGWDPKNERIRCWMFDSDGAFGEGTWSKSDDGWLVKISRTLSDGKAASGTQVIKKIDNDTLTVQTIGQEVDGEPSPTSDPVRVVRVSDEE